jgi:sec-independent protein translocase protein TatC
MTVVEHLEELRNRIVISLIALAVGAAAGWAVYPWVFDFIKGFYTDACLTLPKANQPPKGCDDLFIQSVIEPFLIRVKVSIFTGLTIALPIVLFQLWRFITPGLTDRERRLAIPFVVSSLVLFGLGALFAFLTLPRALGFLLGFGGDTLVPIITAGRYISFVMLVTLAFGISFEFPIVLIFLAWARVVSSRKLRDWRRYAWLFIAIFCALITPSQDPFTMLAMMVPMVLFYEVAVLVARLMKR